VREHDPVFTVRAGALADHFAISDQDLRFEVLLDLFVDGLAFRIALECGSFPDQLHDA
jgi:hypothetical protein